MTQIKEWTPDTRHVCSLCHHSSQNASPGSITKDVGGARQNLSWFPLVREEGSEGSELCGRLGYGQARAHGCVSCAPAQGLHFPGALIFETAAHCARAGPVAATQINSLLGRARDEAAASRPPDSMREPTVPPLKPFVSSRSEPPATMLQRRLRVSSFPPFLHTRN